MLKQGTPKDSLKPIFKAKEAITKAFYVQDTRIVNSRGRQHQLTVSQVYKLSELNCIDQELENKDDDLSPATSSSNKKPRL